MNHRPGRLAVGRANMQQQRQLGKLRPWVMLTNQSSVVRPEISGGRHKHPDGRFLPDHCQELGPPAYFHVAPSPSRHRGRREAVSRNLQALVPPFALSMGCPAKLDVTQVPSMPCSKPFPQRPDSRIPFDSINYGYVSAKVYEVRSIPYMVQVFDAWHCFCWPSPARFQARISCFFTKH